MTWRRFLVLLTGLGPHSAWVTIKSSPHRVITDQDEAEALVARL